MVLLVVLFLAFIFIFAPLGYFMDIKAGLESSRKPKDKRTHKDNDAIYDMRAIIIVIIIAILFIIWSY